MRHFFRQQRWRNVGKANDVTVAECCSMLQHVAVCCSVLQCVAAWEKVEHVRHLCRRQRRGNLGNTNNVTVAVCCSVLKCVTMCGSVLQCVAVSCRALQSWKGERQSSMCDTFSRGCRVVCLSRCLSVELSVKLSLCWVLCRVLCRPPKNGLIALWSATNGRVSTF